MYDNSVDCAPYHVMSISFEREQHPEATGDPQVTLCLDFCASFEFLHFLDGKNKCPISRSIVASPSAIASFKTASMYWACRMEYPAFAGVKEDIQWLDQDRLTLLDSIEKIASSQLAQSPVFPVRIFVTPAWRDVVAPLFPHLVLPRFRGSFAYRSHTIEDRVLLYDSYLAQQTLFSRRFKVPRAFVTQATIDLREVRAIQKAEEINNSLDYSPPDLAKILTALSKVQECPRIHELIFFSSGFIVFRWLVTQFKRPPSELGAMEFNCSLRKP